MNIIQLHYWIIVSVFIKLKLLQASEYNCENIFEFSDLQNFDEPFSNDQVDGSIDSEILSVLSLPFFDSDCESFGHELQTAHDFETVEVKCPRKSGDYTRR